MKEEEPSPSEVRELVDKSLLKGRIDWKRNLIAVPIEAPFKSKIWSSFENDFIAEKTSNLFMFRDIKKLVPNKIGDLKFKIADKDYNQLLSMRTSSLTKESKYKVVEIILIRKILVI